MNSLDRKLFRDLAAVWGQALAISLVIAAGVAMFVMALSALGSLTKSQAAYYDHYRFADIFAYAKRVPNSTITQLADIEGVAQLQTRIVLDVTLNVPYMSEPAKGRLISIPDHGEPKLNSLHLRTGRWITPFSANEVLLAESFASAHGLKTGDQLTAIINGNLQSLKIVGIVLSPEYIIQIPPGGLLPDDRQFGVLWMSQHQLEAAFDMKGAFNSLTLRLLRNANEEEVIKQLDTILDRYGSLGAYGRDNHISHQFISDEIRQLKAHAVIAPILFLSVSSYLLNIVISRIISMQREQIAALKAFGYTNFQVGVHYLKMVYAITIVGSLIGVIGGIGLGKMMTLMYAKFYRFPILVLEINGVTIFVSVFLSLLAATLGTLTALGRASRLPPAQAMRPEPPANYRPTLVERLGLRRFIPQALRMILRKLERNPTKSVLSTFGISMAVAVLILGSFTLDAVTYIMDFQFRRAQRQDMTVTFVEPTNQSTLHDVYRTPGVVNCEPFRGVSCRLRNSYRTRRIGITGLEPGAELFRIFDSSEQEIKIPDSGILLSEKLANLLMVNRGDTIQVEVLEGKRGTYQVPVAAVIKEFSGLNAYMNIQAVNRLLGEGRVVSGAFLKIDQSLVDQTYESLKGAPQVAGISIKAKMLESFEKTLAENILTIRLFNIGFASVIAFGVVYNSARISLSEQSRELATLRVIGFTRIEVSAILLGEIGVLTVLAIPIGCLLGYGFAWAATLGLDTEIYRIPLVVNFSTFAFASLTVAIATFISGWIVRRRINQLDLVAVLKSKE